MRKYQKPESKVIEVAVEGMIASSIVIDANKSGYDQLTEHKNPWDSDNWTGCEEEEW